MSTRCCIKVIFNKREIELYHHCDGYLEGIGYFLAKEMDKHLKNQCSDVDRVVTRWIRECNFEPTFFNHGDIEYYYIVNFNTNEVICNSVDVNDGKMKINSSWNCRQEWFKRPSLDVGLYDKEA